MRSILNDGMWFLAQAAGGDATGDVANFRPTLWYVAPIASALALVFAVYFYKKMMGANEGTPLMREIAQHVREGAMAYLNRQYMTIAGVGIVVFVLLWIFLGFHVGFGYLIGALLSGAAGYIGMNV